MNILKQAFVKGSNVSGFQVPGITSDYKSNPGGGGVMTHSDLIWHAYRTATCDETAQNQMHAKGKEK